MLDSTSIQDRIRKLPPLSTGAGALLDVMARRSREPAEIVKIIEADAALTAGVLRMVNSAALRLTREIATVKEAVAYLGDLKVVGIAVAAAGGELMNAELVGYRGSRGDLGRHCLLTAILARDLARHTQGEVDPGVAYTASLLHDIGKVVLSDYIDQAAEEIFASLRNQTMPDFRSAEQQFLGTDHCDTGYEMAGLWNLPHPLAMGIKYHHLPGEAEPADRALAYVVHLADMLTMEYGVCAGVDGDHYCLDRGYVDHVRLSQAELEDLAPKRREEFEKMAGVMFG